MNNLRKYFYVSFLFLNALCSGMEELPTIHPLIKNEIVNIPGIENAAYIFNEMVKLNHIAPTVANTRWCIHTLADKQGASKDIFKVAQKLDPNLTREWLAHYLLPHYQFNYARLRLQKAIEGNDISLATFLLSSKSTELANSDTTGFSPNSLAYHAAWYNCSEILQLLICSGSDLTRYAQTDYKFAPIHAAAWFGNYNSLQLILDSGLNPDFPCGHGKSALFHLCRQSLVEKKHLECAFLLLDHAANTDIIPAQHWQRDDIIQNLKDILEQYSLRKKII